MTSTKCPEFLTNESVELVKGEIRWAICLERLYEGCRELLPTQGTSPYTGTYYIHVNVVFIYCVYIALHTLHVCVTHSRKPLPTQGHITHMLTLFHMVHGHCPAHVVFIYIRQMHRLVERRVCTLC